MPKTTKKNTKNENPKTKTAKAKAPALASSGIRRVRIPSKRLLRPKKGAGKAKVNRPPLPGAFQLLARSVAVLKRHWKLFLVVIIIYGILDLLLVKGLAGGSNLGTVKGDFQQAFNGHGGQLATGLTLFVYLVGGSGNNANASAGVYQTLLIIITALAVVWTLRELQAGHKIRARDAFYRGMYPLVPFLLVLFVILLQLLPLLLGAFLYATVINAGIAVHIIEKVFWTLLLILLAWASLYMITSSSFALLIATLPDMTPMKALRSARQLVRYRRFRVFLKLLFLPIIILVISIILMLPLILYVTPAASWVFFVISMVGLVVVVSYLYALYRELLV